MLLPAFGLFGLPRAFGLFGLPRAFGLFGLPRAFGLFGLPRAFGLFGLPRAFGFLSAFKLLTQQVFYFHPWPLTLPNLPGIGDMSGDARDIAAPPPAKLTHAISIDR